MSRTYAMPTSPGPNSHDHSHNRQQANSKMLLQPPSINGVHHDPASNGQHEKKSSRPMEAFPNIAGDTSTPSFLQLPIPSSFSSTDGSRTKSLERRKSAGLPTHLNLEGTGYGYTTSRTQKLHMPDAAVVGSGFSARDFLSILLIPLPITLASFVFAVGIIPGDPQSHTSKKNVPIDSNVGGIWRSNPVNFNTSLTIACELTVCTLGFVGIGAKATKLLVKSGDAQPIFTWASLQKMRRSENIWRIVGRISTVGLPFYATSCLGGVRVATITLSAMASGMMITGELPSTSKAWKEVIRPRRWLAITFVLQMLVDLLGLTSNFPTVSVVFGYVLLGVSFILPSAFPNMKPQPSRLSAQTPASSSSSQKSAGSTNENASRPETSPLTSTSEDVDLTLAAALLLGLVTMVFSVTTASSAGARTSYAFAWSALTSLSASFALCFADTRSLSRARGIGSLFGSISAALLTEFLYGGSWMHFMYQILLISISYTGVFFNLRSASSVSSCSAHHNYKHHPHHIKSHPSEILDASRITNSLLPWVRDWPLLHTILSEKDSRRIFYFMCLNFAFMLVQTFYGIVSGSLGLLSDSIHMFFDCLALIVGLCAAVMSKWPPSRRFPYGYAKIETLAGFANGVFLMLISIEIIYEAIERLSEGTNVKRLNELMTVSIMGLMINVVGILAFGHAHHGHDHSHGHSHDHTEHSHNNRGHRHHEHVHDTHDQHDHHDHHQHGPGSSQHDHDDQEHTHSDQSEPKMTPSFPKLNGFADSDLLGVPSPTPSMYSSVPATPSKPSYSSQNHSHVQSCHNHGHGHGHGHGHDHHHSENMMGIYLHVLGDTLGSLAVVISTWLVQWNGWSGWDPVASTCIAVIIFGTAIPLVKNCARKLLLTVPEDVEYDLREALAGLSGLRGVVGCTVPKFWIQDGEHSQVMGVVHVMADKVNGLEDVKERSLAFLKGAGLNVLVQVEREGSSRCWCQATK